MCNQTPKVIYYYLCVSFKLMAEPAVFALHWRGAHQQIVTVQLKRCSQEAAPQNQYLSLKVRRRSTSEQRMLVEPQSFPPGVFVTI